ncbi:hypothetical protein AVEN_58254-1 [Araneus ventricosus]|uniref:RNase H type-1 domain-containing protein n=1 Tax=Araneus ventricosus TaxID=182803 RepID=A0A4Y2PU33_ARAVE|nr:hypothetical protein AVEN_58254-1 [Araneus ventricosus]
MQYLKLAGNSKTSQEVISKVLLLQKVEFCFQWIPSHVGVLAMRRQTCLRESALPSRPLVNSSSEIFSIPQEIQTNSAWKIPHTMDWYAGTKSWSLQSVGTRSICIGQVA